MKLETIKNAVNTTKNGTCVRLGYVTEVPIKTKYKDDLNVRKLVATTGRLGVEYKNIKSVKERLTSQVAKSVRVNNFSWVIRNKLKYNSNTDKYYLSVASFPKGSNTKSVYEVRKGNGLEYFFTEKDLEKFYGEYIQPSFFKKKTNPSEVYIINIDNVFAVGNVYEGI